MKNLYIILLLFFCFSEIYAQDTEIKSDTKKVKHFNLIKAGSSIQFDVHPNFKYDSYYDDYYYERYNAPGGLKYTAYLSFEHIWEFKNKLAIAVEPKAGFARLINATYLFAGNDLKFYWANNSVWRSGIALSTDYYFGKTDVEFAVTMGDGNYRQLIETNIYSHNINIGIGIIPFQYHFQKIPLVIETKFTMVGLGLLFENSEEYKEPDGTTNQYNDFTKYPFMVKPEIRIGVRLP